MRVVIAGGNSFVGREVTSQLLMAGHEVTWLSNTPGRISPPPGVREVPFLVHGKDQWHREVGASDGVINLSGFPIASRWNPQVKRLLRDSRVETGRALVDAITRARSEADGPGVFVSASGIGVYGNAGSEVVDETTPPGNDWLAELASHWEQAALAATAAGCRVVTLRTGLVLGDEGLVPRMALPMKMFVGGPVGSGSQWVSWIHIHDIGAAYVHALTTASLSGPVNAAAPEPLTMRDFSAAMGRVLHRPSWFPVPEFVLRVVLGEVAPYTLFSQRISSHKLRASGFAYRYADIDRALADILGPDDN